MTLYAIKYEPKEGMTKQESFEYFRNLVLKIDGVTYKSRHDKCCFIVVDMSEEKLGSVQSIDGLVIRPEFQFDMDGLELD